MSEKTQPMKTVEEIRDEIMDTDASLGEHITNFNCQDIDHCPTALKLKSRAEALEWVLSKPKLSPHVKGGPAE